MRRTPGRGPASRSATTAAGGRRRRWQRLLFLATLLLSGCTSGPPKVSRESWVLDDAFFSPHDSPGGRGGPRPTPPRQKQFDLDRDKQVVFWAFFRNPGRDVSGRMELVGPDESEAGTSYRFRVPAFNTSEAAARYYWNQILPRGLLESSPGEWTVVVFLDDHRVGAASFAIERSGSARPPEHTRTALARLLDAARAAQRRGEHARALELADQAERSAVAAGGARAQIAAARRLAGLARWQLGDSREALRLLGEAVAQSEADGDAVGRAEGYLALAQVHHTMGRLQRAVELVDAALPLLKASDHPPYPDALWRAGKLRLDLNRFTDAERLFEQAGEEAARRKQWPLWSRALAAGIEAQRRRGDARPSIGLLSGSGRRPDAQEVLGWWYLELGFLELADDYFRLSAQAFQASAGPLAALGPLLGLARLELARGNVDGARAHLARVEPAIDRAGLTSQTWRFWLVKGLVRERDGDDPGALENLLKAAREVELLRGQIQVDELRASYAEDKQELYESLIRVALRLRRHREAFEAIERAKSRAFLDLLVQRRQAERAVADTGELAQHDELGRAQRALEAEVTALQRDEVARPEEVERKTQALRRVAEQRGVLIQKLAATRTRTVEVAAQPSQIEELRRRLPADGVLLNYFVGRRLSVVGVLTADGVDVIELSRLFEADVLAFARIAGDPSSTGWQVLGRALYASLLAPLAPTLQAARTVIVSPHRALHYLPFHALLTPDGQFAAARWRITYLPSASVLTQLPVAAVPRRTLLAVGNPTLPGAPPLPGAEVEVRGLASLFPARVLIGDDATKPRVLALAAEHHVLHFATHAELDVRQPLDSSLRLTPAGGDDGRLTVDEVFNLQLDAEMVVLSACSTGLGASFGGEAVSAGDELVGLSRAFLYAGTRSLVVTLWPVADETSADFVLGFYRALRTRSKAEALQAAQAAFIQAGPSSPLSHPFYWAGFILVGDGT